MRKNIFTDFSYYHKSPLSHPQKSIKYSRILIAGFYLCFFAASRPVWTHLGFPIPMQLMNRIGTFFTFSVFVWGAYSYIFKYKIYLLFRKNYLQKVKLWFILVIIYAFYGMLSNNQSIKIISEFISFIYIGIFLLIAGDDGFCHVILKHLTIMFYTAVLFIFLFYDTPMLNANDIANNENTIQVISSQRYTWSIGYYLRPLISSGLLIGIYGLNQAKWGLLKFFQVMSLIFYFACDVAIFQFRSTGIFIILAILIPLFFPSFRKNKTKIEAFIFFGVLGALILYYYTSTSSWVDLQYRIYSGSQNGLFNSRINELKAYLSDMKWMILIGRGLGGTYDASSVFYGASHWSTIHFGILIFTLKGGLPFFFLFINFIKTGWLKRNPLWYKNPFNFNAIILLPVYCLRLTTIPLLLAPESLFIIFPFVFIFARLGRKLNLKDTIAPINCMKKTLRF